MNFSIERGSEMLQLWVTLRFMSTLVTPSCISSFEDSPSVVPPNSILANTWKESDREECYKIQIIIYLRAFSTKYPNKNLKNVFTLHSLDVYILLEI